MRFFLSKPGLICACGSNPDEFFDSITNGDQSGIKETTLGKTEDGEDRKFFVGKIGDSKLKKTGDKYEMRLLQIFQAALDEIAPAVEKAVAKFGRERVGVCIGSCDNGSELSLKAHKDFFENGAFPKEYDLEIQGADYPASFCAKKFGIKGLSLAFSTACSSSASAIAKAREFLQAGMLDAVVCGGVDVASETVLLGFGSLGAVSDEITNPMSRNRHGITLGEGAAVFVLSKEDLDGTGIELFGAGESSDASHMTAPLEDGSGAAAAMESALNDAGISAEKIDYVNLHATGTKLNDSMEAKAVDKVFSGRKVPVSGTKPMTGHTLGAAGSLELAACFLAIEKQKLPIHLNDGAKDEAMPELNLVRKAETASEIRTCMSNSFAFGGCNVSLIIGKTNGEECR
ncbi:MAG: 3-oxoacyl-ACP synthase [Treponema sp.]|nr:3-oxoacyl-ACP synthase [Treponema sp.]